MKYKNCSKCGHTNPMENVYCSKCGTVFKNMLPHLGNIEISKKEQVYQKHHYVWVIAGIAAALVLTLVLLLGGVHKHTWSDAACTTPRICEECGETEGVALGHKWHDATCTIPEGCDVCGATEGIPLGHNWNEATCTSARICKICGETEGAVLGHQWIDATYEDPKTCNVCGETEGEALVRNWIYLNELSYEYHDGKVWTMSSESPNYYADSNITDPEAYTDEKTPGHVTGPVYDHLGNSYTYGLCVDGLEYKTYEITYSLDGQYDTFSGYISMTPDVWQDQNADDGKYFEVYGDGNLIGRTPVMTNDLPAQSFSFDISGVNFLTIIYPKTSGPSRMAMIFDGKLSVD